MKTFRLNTIIIAITLIAVIGVMGVGYAEWKSDVRITGDISTGSVEGMLNQFNTYSAMATTMVITNPGEVRVPFTVTNTGTLPITIDSMSDNIEMNNERLTPGCVEAGYIITDIPDGIYGSYLEELSGTVYIVGPNDSWSKVIDIVSSLQVDIPEPVRKIKTPPVDPLMDQPVNGENPLPDEEAVEENQSTEDNELPPLEAVETITPVIPTDDSTNNNEIIAQ